MLTMLGSCTATKLSGCMTVEPYSNGQQLLTAVLAQRIAGTSTATGLGRTITKAA
jgi:hypothetical protein